MPQQRKNVAGTMGSNRRAAAEPACSAMRAAEATKPGMTEGFRRRPLRRFPWRPGGRLSPGSNAALPRGIAMRKPHAGASAH